MQPLEVKKMHVREEGKKIQSLLEKEQKPGQEKMKMRRKESVLTLVRERLLNPVVNKLFEKNKNKAPGSCWNLMKRYV